MRVRNFHLNGHVQSLEKDDYLINSFDNSSNYLLSIEEDYIDSYTSRVSILKFLKEKNDYPDES